MHFEKPQNGFVSVHNVSQAKGVTCETIHRNTVNVDWSSILTNVDTLTKELIELPKAARGHALR